MIQVWEKWGGSHGCLFLRIVQSWTHGLCNSSPGVTTQGWLLGLGVLENGDRWDRGRIFWWENAFHCSYAIQSPLIFFLPALSDKRSKISFQRPPHGHDTWTGVRAVWSLAEARRARGETGHNGRPGVCPAHASSAISAPGARRVMYRVALAIASPAWWFWPVRLPLRPLMCEWKTKLSLPMSPVHRQRDCSSGNTGQEVRGGSWPFVLNTALLWRPVCQHSSGQ